MEEKRAFKGIWIPKEIWLSKDLTLQEKVFLVEIDSLDNENGCYASNKYFSEFFGLSKVRVSNVINELIKKGYISSEIVYKENSKEIKYRVLKINRPPYPCFLYEGIKENDNTPIKENFKGNNTINNNTDNNIYSASKETPKLSNTDIIRKVIEYMNKCGALEENFKNKKEFHYNPNGANNKKLITARIKEGYTLDNFKDVIYHGYEKFIENEQLYDKTPSSTYYRPGTLFSSENFENYLNQYELKYGGKNGNK